MYTWIDKVIRALDHPIGKKLVARLPEDVDIQVIGNALITLGVPENKVCGILSLYSQLKPEGGLIALLKDEDLRGFLEIFVEEEKPQLPDYVLIGE